MRPSGDEEAPFLTANPTTAEWEHLQLLLQTRSGNCCEARTEACAAGPHGELHGLTRDQVVIHHRQPRGMGGTDRLDAHSLAVLVLICARCHDHIEAGERGLAIATGWLVPFPVPGRHSDATDPRIVPIVSRSGRRRRLHPTSPVYLEPLDGIPYLLAS